MEGTYIGDMLDRLGARLNALELQAASKGIDTEPHILNEISDIKSRIEQLQMSTKSLVSIELLQRMAPLEIWKRLYDAIWEIELIIYTLKNNAEADRMRIQSRHTEFNITVQRNTFEIDILKLSQRRITIAFVAFIIAIVIMLFIFALLR